MIPPSNDSLRGIAFIALMASWVAFGTIFTVCARRVQRQRSQDPLGESKRKTAPRAKYGIILEGIGIGFVWVPRSPGNVMPGAIIAAALILAFVSVWLGWMAIRELGQQWRIQAVVTEKHQLVTTGPYAWIRHPIYASLMGMMIATGLIVGRWPCLLIAMVFYIIGTEIRIHEEEKLLAEQFGGQFQAYRTRVRAYLPGIR